MSKHYTLDLPCGCRAGYITSVTPPRSATADGGVFAEPCELHSRKLRFEKQDYEKRLLEIRKLHEAKIAAIEAEYERNLSLAALADIYDKEGDEG